MRICSKSTPRPQPLVNTWSYDRECKLLAESLIWNPRILLANETGIVRQSFPEDVEIEPDGTVIYRQRYVGTLSQPLDLTRFPMDKHVFTIQLVAVGHEKDELEFLPAELGRSVKIVGGGISQQLLLPDWEITNYEVKPKPYEPVPGDEVAGFAFEFTAKRCFAYYLWQLIVPLGVTVAMSWSTFWIDPTQSGARIGVATSSILSLVAFRFVVAALLPPLPYMTRMDYYTLGSTLLVFIALTLVVSTSYLVYYGHTRLARKIDLASRLSCPMIFVVLVAISFFI